MNAWCLKFMDHLHFPSHEMLCQTFTAATFSCCLFVGLFVFSNWKAALLSWHQVTDLATEDDSILTCFPNMFGVIIHLHCERPPQPFCRIWLNVSQWLDWYPSEFILLYLSAVTSSLNSSEPVLLAAIHTPATTQPPLCLAHDVVDVPFLLQTFLFPSFNTSLSWFHMFKISDSRTWEAKSIPVLECYLGLAPCFESSVFTFIKASLDSLYYDNLTFTWVFLTLCCEKGFFFTKERILLTSISFPSLVFRAFWAQQCNFSCLEYTKLLSLWHICFAFSP